MKTFIVSILLCLPISLFAQSKTGAQLMKSAPLSFIENKGQITDQNGNPRADIDYKLSASPDLNIFIGNGAIHYQFRKPLNENPKFQFLPIAIGTKFHPSCTGTSLSFEEGQGESMYRLDVELEGANPNAQVVAEDLQCYYENYYTAAAHGAVAGSYNKITYKNIYPNIDWVLYISSPPGGGRDGAFEYDFIVRPGGNVSDIKIKYNGPTDLTHSGENIKATTPFGSISEQKLYAYEQSTGKQIEAKFTYQNNTLGFSLLSANDYKLTTNDCPLTTIIIDPRMQWATYYGGGDETGGGSLAANTTGDLYVTGGFSNIINIATVGAYQIIYQGGGADAFLAKFTSNETVEWATYYGGSGADGGSCVAYDRDGNIFIGGGTYSTSNIATPGAYQSSFGGGGDGFIAKFTTTGALIWATYYGGSGADGVNGIICDSAGDTYITGNTSSTDSIATSGSYQSNIGTVFLAKFSGAGTLLWGTYYGGYGINNASGITIDSIGSVYITGFTTSIDSIATIGAYQSTCGGDEDAFLAKFTPAGALQWATYYGGSGRDQANGIASDKTGNIYIAGSTNSRDSIATPSAYLTVCNYGNSPSYSDEPDAFLAKFSDSGTIEWATYYGVNGSTGAIGVATDNLGNVYMEGHTTCTDSISTAGAYQSVYQGGQFDAFITEFNNTGSLLWGSYFGGKGADYGVSVTCDDIGNFYLLGETTSQEGIATLNAYDTTYYGTTIYAPVTFIAKFDSMRSDEVTQLNTPKNTVNVYPNPASNTLYISWQSIWFAQDDITISIINMIGQQVYTASIPSQINRAAVDVSMLPAGIYTCVLQSKMGQYYKKIILDK